MLCRIQFDCVDLDATMPGIARNSVDQMPFTSRRLKDTNKVAPLETLESPPGTLRQIHRGWVVLKVLLLHGASPFDVRPHGAVGFERE
jgi:hypothetical protein